MPESSGEKTEKATPHKRREQRKEGNVMQSRDVVTAAFILLVFFTLRIMAEYMYRTISGSMTYWISLSGEGMDGGNTIDGMGIPQKLILEIGKVVLLTAGPILLLSVAVPVIVTGIQTKFIFSKKSLKFKLDKLNPFKGIQKMFSLSSAFELAKSIAKLVILIAVVYDEIKGRITGFARLVQLDPAAGLIYTADAIFAICMKIAAVFVAVAAIDFLFQKYKWEKDMKMTKQEVKEEFKQMEGDPQIKSKRRQKQQQLAMSRMMQEVPQADVVIRNPTHFAVALRYDEDSDRAPVVVAKGADNVAFRIIEKAEESGVTVVENVPLARGLYAAVDLGREIPYSFYQPVVEVFAFVYGLKGKKPKGVS